MAVTMDFPTFHTQIFILIDWIFTFLIEFIKAGIYFGGKQNHPDKGC